MLSIGAKCQDIIVKRTGDSLTVKLIEVDPLNLKYKLFNYQEGPLFVLPKEEVKYVVFGNGLKEMYDKFVPPARENKPDLTLQPAGKFYYYKEKKIAEKDMLAICLKQKDPKLNHMIKKVENLRFIQQTTTVAGIGLFVAGLYIYETNRPIRQRRGAPPVNSSGRAQAQKNGSIIMLSGVACSLISVFFHIDRKRHDRVVVNTYNDIVTRLN